MRYNMSFVALLNRLFGPWSGLRLVVAHLLRCKRVEVLLRPVGQRIICRPWTGDFAALREIFKNEALPEVALVNARYVADLGANVGYATQCLATIYPEAAILSVEPDKENYDLLSENTLGLENVIVRNYAVGKHDGWLALSNAGSDSVSRKFEKMVTSGYGVRAVTMQTLLEEVRFPRLDVVKIDIEGAEKELFAASDLSWLDGVVLIMIEFHGRDIETAVRSVLTDRGFVDYGRWGDKWVFRKGR